MGPGIKATSPSCARSSRTMSASADPRRSKSARARTSSDSGNPAATRTVGENANNTIALTHAHHAATVCAAVAALSSWSCQMRPFEETTRCNSWYSSRRAATRAPMGRTQSLSPIDAVTAVLTLRELDDSNAELSSFARLPLTSAARTEEGRCNANVTPGPSVSCCRACRAWMYETSVTKFTTSASAKAHGPPNTSSARKKGTSMAKWNAMESSE